jgi:hypothetical protein
MINEIIVEKKIFVDRFFVVIIFQTISIQIHDEKKVFEKDKMNFFTKKRSEKSRRKLLTKTSQKFFL